MKKLFLLNKIQVLLICAMAFMLWGCHGSRSGSSHGYKSLDPQGPRYTQQQTNAPGYYSGAPSGGQHHLPMGRPHTFSEFKERYAQVSTSPQGAVRMYFDALFSYIDPARRAEGAKMLRYSLHEGQNLERSPVWSTFVSRLQDPAYHYIFRSFAQGTSPENNYQMNPDNYQLMFVKSRQETDYVQITIRSSGADSPRPVHVQRFDDGLWYVVNNHGTYTEVRKPAGYRQQTYGSHDADLD